VKTAILLCVTLYVIMSPVAAQHDRFARRLFRSRLTPGRGGITLEHNMNKQEKLADLRRSLNQTGLPPDRPLVSLGVTGADDALGGGLLPGALHEIHAGDWGAAGFAACLAIRMASSKPLFWVRPDYEALEYGGISPNGLLELGGDPARLVMLAAPNATEALAAAADILACPHVGVLVLELSRNPASLDLVASRRLAFAAAQSGVTVLALREGAVEMPNAALSRWQVKSAPSSSGDDWGEPAFTAQLVRNRLGPTGNWTMQWDVDHGLFRETRHDQYAPHPGRVAAAFAHRPDLSSRQSRASDNGRAVGV
jgi:protein ImuA